MPLFVNQFQMGWLLVSGITWLALLASQGSALSFQEKYMIWAADLQPGFMIINDTYIDGRRCYCKVAIPTSTTTSTPATTTTNTIQTTTVSNPTSTTSPVSTSSTPVTTTTTPQSTTTSPASTSTTTTPHSTTSTPISTTTSPASTTTSPASTTTTPVTTTTTPVTTTSTPVSTTTTPVSTTTTPVSSTTTPVSTTSTPKSTTTSPISSSTTPKSSTTTPVSSTTTPPSTTTPVSSTTVQFPATTTAGAGLCGADCNKTIIVNNENYGDGALSTEYWSSPNYPNDYPDGCYCCLYIELQVAGFIAIGFNSGDEIYAVNNCDHDRIDFTGSFSNLNTICDTTVGGESNFMNKNHDAVVEGTACFTSDPADGNTVAKGFNMTITIQNFSNQNK